MALSAQTLRPGPYSLPQPGLSRLSSSCSTVPYNSPAFSNAHLQQQQQHYSINYATSPPSHAAGLSFQNSVLLPGGSQCSMLPPSSTTSIQLPGSPESVVLPSTPGPRKHSVGSHDSPINPGSPILDDDSSGGDQYKNCQYRSTIGSMGINTPFNSFSPHHHQSTSLPHLATGMGYPSPSSMCPSSMYASQDSTLCHSTSVPQPLGMPVWSYPTIPNMNIQQQNTMAKLSMDTPRFKLTPERAVSLMKWFEDHKEHPYPTRHEKMMLCQATQLTYTQVSTWFANARRRLKKSNSDDQEECRSNHSSSDDCASHNSLDSPLQSNDTGRSFNTAPDEFTESRPHEEQKQPDC